MDWALDSVKNQYVNAELAMRRVNYICPNCGAPVSLRKGLKIKAYFAHVTGKANAACELYIPYKKIISSFSLEDYYRTLELYLRIIKNVHYFWNLEIGIPEPDVKAGKLKIPFCMGRRKNCSSSYN